MTTTTAAVHDGRHPSCWLNYPSKVELDPFEPYGPNTLGETLWMVSVEYNPALNRSRVGFSLIAPRPSVVSPL